MAYHVVREEFKSFAEMLNIINGRPNSEYMRGKKESMERESSGGWYGTKNWTEACTLLGTGYLDVLSDLKKNIAMQNKLNSKFVEMIDRPRPSIGVQGYVPCVPNALRNLPKSMINIDRKPQKRKTLHILYSIGGNCGMSADWFVKAGTALLSAVEIVEKGGIQTKIDLNFFPAKSGEEITFPTITIKNYGERYSVQKVSFPLVHPSMFRRFGFKWLETSPGIKTTYPAYGSEVPYNTMKEALEIKDPKTYFISTRWISDHKNSVEEILKMFEVI